MNTSMQLDREVLIRIGSDPRWLYGGLKLSGKVNDALGTSSGRRSPAVSMLAEMLEQHLGRDDAQWCLAQAAMLTLTSRQVAIRQYLSEGIHAAFSPDQVDRKSRRAILQKIQKLLFVHDGHANRVVNGLGIFSKELGTENLVDHYIGHNSNFIRELDVDLIQLLACGAGENLDTLLLKPYQFISNTACAALRLRISSSEGDDLMNAKLRIRKAFPPFTQNHFFASKSSVETLTPQATVALYGLALWQSVGRYLCEPSEQDADLGYLCNDTLSSIVRLAAIETPWVFPELCQIEIDSVAIAKIDQHEAVLNAKNQQRDRLIAAQSDVRYHDTIRVAVETMGLEVGKAICGLEPYLAEVGERTHDVR